MVWVLVVILLGLLVVLYFGFKKRCPACGKLFALEQASTPQETNRRVSMGWSVNPMVDKDLKFSGFTTSRVPKETRTVKIRYRCKACGYEFSQHEEMKSNSF